MKARSGYFRAGAIAGAPIFLHWSLPLGPFVFSGFRFIPGLFFSILAIILVHELGHALVAKARGCQPQAIEMHALGGLCRAQINTEMDGVSIAWGGVLAQLWLYVTVRLAAVFWFPETQQLQYAYEALTYTNLVIAAFNLIPIAPFDGAEAWKIFSVLGWFRVEKIVTKPTAADDSPRARRREVHPVERVRETAGAGSVEIASEEDAALAVKEALAKAREDARASRDGVT